MIKKLATLKEIATLNDMGGIVIIKDEPGYNDGIYNITATSTELLLETSGSKPLPILTEYPTKDPSKAGERFWYRGSEWHYMTQEEIDALGWPETKGFPAPVYKNVTNHFTIYSTHISNEYATNEFNAVLLGYLVNRLFIVEPRNLNSVTNVRNLHLLISLKDVGTQKAFDLSGYGNKNASAETINKIFTQLPSTTNVATIDVRHQPGSLTCNPTIATSKGYTVIT